VRFK